MRRLLASIALSAILVGVLSPFAVATQFSTFHACCLRVGKHHCKQSSEGTGFHASSSRCPYSFPVVVTGITGLHAAKFNLLSPVLRKNSVQGHAATFSSQYS